MARDNVIRPNRFAATDKVPKSPVEGDLRGQLFELRDRAFVAGEQAYAVHIENMTIVRRINEILSADNE